jgi:quinol monooxygenase YgiN
MVGLAPLDPPYKFLTRQITMIRVIATIQLRAGCRSAFLKVFKALVPHVRQEPGCRDYEPMADLPTNFTAQVPVRGDVITIVEQWESLDALEAHLIAPHMLEYRKAVKGFVAGVTLQVLQPAE